MIQPSGRGQTVGTKPLIPVIINSQRMIRLAQRASLWSSALKHDAFKQEAFHIPHVRLSVAIIPVDSRGTNTSAAQEPKCLVVTSSPSTKCATRFHSLPHHAPLCFGQRPVEFLIHPPTSTCSLSASAWPSCRIQGRFSYTLLGHHSFCL